MGTMTSKSKERAAVFDLLTGAGKPVTVLRKSSIAGKVSERDFGPGELDEYMAWTRHAGDYTLIGTDGYVETFYIEARRVL